ncbi:MAG TPA: Ig-like domain repeat protein, partial [Isosphaeraceae bacterium]|nr:Ig-like domain repeat protein [Isosphaeraceae bacterium]
ITGPGATVLTVSGGGPSSSFSVFTMYYWVTACISGLTISNGNADSGGGVYNDGSLTLANDTLSGNSATDGGGVYNDGSLTLANDTLSGNSAYDYGGGVDNYGTVTLTNDTLSENSADYYGGGISNWDGTVTLTNDTLSGNSATAGGGISNYGGTMTLTNDTLSGNSATADGGGVYNDNYGTATLTNDTLSGNSADYGGGIYNDPSGTVTPGNTIIAGNTASFAGPDVSGGVTSQGSNLIGKTDGSSGWVATDLTGTVASPLDPQLNALADNGGPTETMALLPGSPAIDAGSNALANEYSLATDQRGAGFPRIVNGTVDIGAFEAQQETTTTVVTASPSTSVSGQTVTFTATVAPQAGSAVPTATGSIQFEIDGSNFGSPVALVNGSATSAAISSLSVASHTVSALYASNSADFMASTGSTSITVEAATQLNIQSVVNNAPSAGGSVTLQTTSSGDVSTAVQAVNGANPSSPVTVTLDLGGASTSPTTAFEASSNVQVDLTSSSGNATVSNATVTSGTVVVAASVAPVDWTVNGGNVIVNGSASAGDFIVNGGTVTLADGTVITGNSPAIIVNGGTVVLQGVTAKTATNSPTIVVNDGGSLTIRNSTIEELTGYAQAAILINGGTVDLGSTLSPGHNVLNVNGTGELVHNATSSSVPDIGNTLEVNGTPLLAPYLSFTALASSSASSVYGQSVTLTADVRAANTSDGTPSGVVAFLDTTTGANLGSASVTNGVATLITSALAVGSHIITADYEGNSSFAFSLSTLTQTVQQDSTTTSVTLSASTASFGQAVTFTAKIAANAPGSGTPSGTFDFYDTTTSTDLTPGGVALSSGTATFSTTSLAVGSHTIKASYSGDTNFIASSASTGTVTIGQSIIVLDPSAGGALSLSGNASINLTGGVYVDSRSSTALSASGNAQVKASVIDVHGGVQKSGSASFSPTPIAGAATVPDPLASLAAPSTSDLTNCGSESLSGNSSATINPGIYSQISVSGNGTLTLNSGIYIIEGGGFTVSGNASVSGSGVMIFNAGSKYPTTGGTYGSITLSGNGSYKLSPPATGAYAGIVIFQTRDNSKALTVSGNASGVTGTVYAPAAQLAESGNAALNAAVIVDTMTVSGNGIANTLTLDAPSGTVAYTPAQIRAAYGISKLSLDGSGQTIAIVDAYDDPSIYQALDAFDSQFGLTGSAPTLYNQYGPASSFLTMLNQYGQATSLPSTNPNGPGTSNWELEEALDVEWAHAIAPGAQIILVEANSQSLSDLMASVATAASQPGVS